MFQRCAVPFIFTPFQTPTDSHTQPFTGGCQVSPWAFRGNIGIGPRRVQPKYQIKHLKNVFRNVCWMLGFQPLKDIATKRIEDPRFLQSSWKSHFFPTSSGLTYQRAAVMSSWPMRRVTGTLLVGLTGTGAHQHTFNTHQYRKTLKLLKRPFIQFICFLEFVYV